MSRTAQTEGGDITIDSNWVITIGLAVLFAFTAFLLGWSIRDLLFDNVGFVVSLGLRRGWFDTLTHVLGLVYSFVFGYSFPAKKLKVAFSLLGIKYTILAALPYLPVSADAVHSGAIAVAIASQIAYVIILFAVAQWFMTVVRRAPPTDREVSSS